MATSHTSESVESLINRGLSLNIRSINSRLTKLFQRYSIALNKINGGELFGRIQTRQIQDIDGISIEYDKGKIVFKNDIDKLRYLIDHRQYVSEAIGVPSTKIVKHRRDAGKMEEYIARLDGKYDLGEQDKIMQMYISKYDGNVGSLDSQLDWVDYILTKDWITQLAKRVIDNVELSEQEKMFVDYRIEYLADMVQGMVTDHEIDYHRNIGEFDPNVFLDKVKYFTYAKPKKDEHEPLPESKYADAFNRLNSFGKLEYGFYEL